MSNFSKKLILFFIAITVRILCGYIFLGSSDFFFSLNLTEELLSKSTPFTSHMPYFPVLAAFVWLGSILGIKTALPIAFCQKIIPILFDTLLALLIYDFVQKNRPEHAFKSGLLYALSPIAIIVNCIHAQWDSIPLFLLALCFYVRDYYENSYKKFLLTGILFSLSFLLKPFTAIFILFLFIPRKTFKLDAQIIWRYILFFSIFSVCTLAALYIFFKTSTYHIQDVCAALNIPLLLILTLLSSIIFMLLFYYKFWLKFSDNFKKYLLQNITILIGISFTTLLFFGLFTYFGFNLFKTIDTILRHFNQGAQQFGLPFTTLCTQTPLHLFFKNRFWIMLPITITALGYYKEKIDIQTAWVLVFALILGFSGYLTAYPLWLMPFLLIAGYYKLGAIYNGIVSIFMILFYAHPLSNPVMPYQSAASFAPLKQLEWLNVPEIFTQKFILPVITLLGNYAIPITCLYIVFYTVLSISKKTSLITPKLLNNIQIFKSIYFIFLLALTSIIFLVYTELDKTNLAHQWATITPQKLAQYDTQIIAGKYVTNYGPIEPFNIIFILLTLTLIWSMYALFINSKKPKISEK